MRRAALLGLLVAAFVVPTSLASPTDGSINTRDCGDIRGATWGTSEGTRSIAGSHYTVSALNFSCATARRLAAKMTYKKSPGTGVNRTLLPGYVCLVSVPTGFRLSRGACSVGPKIVLMGANVKNFSWHVCEAVPSRHEHMQCTVRRTT